MSERFKDVIPPNLNRLKRERPARTFWFTGHSLGAVLATLARSRYAHGGLYTFGSPRPGDRVFARSIGGGAFRFVHHNDVVARLPPPGILLRYRHVGALKYITHDGQIRDRCTIRGYLRWFWRETLGRWFEADGTVADRVPGGLVNELADHAPIHYARLIRRQIEGGGDTR